MMIKRSWKILVAMMASFCVSVVGGGSALAKCASGDPKCEEVETTILPSDWANGDGIMKVLGLVLKILVYGLGAAATLGVIIAGILYLTARDNPQQVAKAKMRLFQIALGLVAWAVIFTLLNWLIPGFNKDTIPSV